MANRKLIRPSLKDIKETPNRPPEPQQPAIATSIQNQGNLAFARRKHIPAEQTNAESFYYLKQMQTKTPMVITLQDGEQIRGVIEWYDRHCLKINRYKEPNLMILKHNIKYMYKQEDEPRGLRRRGRSSKERDNETNNKS
ncbi:MAG: RNA chaperone Hfq [Acidobacteria bacterium]|nr:RNA chaperone Hfq [Acidobacteriota bacterium]